MEDAAWYGVCNPGHRIALIAPTFADARDTMVEGDSGIVNLLPHEMIKAWNRSLGELILVNEARFKLFSAEEPERLRGPQHHRAYCDELAAWVREETWDQMLFGIRLGVDPKVVIATTPKPTPLVRRIVADPKTTVTRGSTFDNAANLAQSAIDTLRAKYEGTRLGRQELYAEILDDVPGALWTRTMVEAAIWPKDRDRPEMRRVVVAVDPSGTKGDGGGDDIGIVVAGIGVDGRGYVIADRTCQLPPAGWGARVITAQKEFGADRIVAETNFGGALVESVIRSIDRSAPFKAVTASRGKVQRAEPVAALYEQGRVSHLAVMPELEDQMTQMTATGFLGDGSPDRVDALVWSLTELMLGDAPRPWDEAAL